MANRLELILAASTTQLEAGMARATDAVEQLSDEARSLKGSLSEAGDAVADVADTNRWQGMAQAGEFISNAAQAAGALAGKFLEAGKQLDDLKDRLGTFVAADQVDSVADSMLDLAAKTGASEDALITAAQKMGTFGQFSQDNLQRVVDLAAKTGKGIEQTANAFVLLGAGGPAASEAVNQLAKDFGISADELARHGAVLDENGKLLADTPAHAQAAQQALQAFIDTNAAGAAEEQTGALDELNSRFEVLQKQIGQHTLKAYEDLAGAMLPVLDILEDMPAPMKAVIGVGTGVVGSLGNIAGTGLQAAANLKLLGFNAATTGPALAKAGMMGRAAFTAMLGPLGLVLTTVGLIAAGLAIYTAELDAANAAAEDLLKTEERRAAAVRKFDDYLGKSGDELHRIGVKSKELVDVIGGVEDRIEQARGEGNDARVAELEAQLKKLQQAKVKLIELEDAEKAAKAARDERIKTPAAPAADLKGLEDLKKATDAATKSTQDLGTARVEAAQAPPPAPPAPPAAPSAAETTRKQAEASKKQEQSADRSAKTLERAYHKQEAASEKQVEAAQQAAAATERAAEATERASKPSGGSLNPILGSVQDFVESQKRFAVGQGPMQDPPDVGSGSEEAERQREKDRMQALGDAVQARAEANTGLRSAAEGAGGGNADLLAAIQQLVGLQQQANSLLQQIASKPSGGGGGRSSFSGSGIDWGYFSSGSTP